LRLVEKKKSDQKTRNVYVVGWVELKNAALNRWLNNKTSQRREGRERKNHEARGKKRVLHLSVGSTSTRCKIKVLRKGG